VIAWSIGFFCPLRFRFASSGSCRTDILLTLRVFIPLIFVPFNEAYALIDGSSIVKGMF